MKTTDIKTGLGFALMMGLALAIPDANAWIVSAVEGPEGDSVIGIGMGAEPDYMGSLSSRRGAVPQFRYQFYDNTYFLLLGSKASFNLVNDENWRFGPMVNYRYGRGSSVEDPVVKQMVGINGTAETGVFLKYSTKLGQDKTQQMDFSGDVASGRKGTVGNLRMTYWLQMSPGNTLHVGVGTTIASGNWMQTYFGVTNASDIALYPSLAGRPFNASSGVKGSYISLGLTQALSKTWLMSIGFRYEKLMNAAKNSPVTAQRGSSNQWMNTVVLSYHF
jgi:outer membrane protein